MNQCFDSFITAVTPYIPAALISPDHLGEIARIAGILPAKLSSFFGFECHLGDSSPRADFLMHIQASEGGREILAGFHSANQWPEFIQTDSVWNRLRNFCKHWADPTSVLHKKADHIWLEFDVADQGVSAKPIPSFFFGPRGIDSGKAADKSPHPHQWVLNNALQELLGTEIPSAFGEKIFQCFDMLPVGSKVFQIGTMLSRPLLAIRICIKDISPDTIAAYLSKLQWEGSTDEVKALCSKLSGFVDRIVLDIDVIKGNPPCIGPKIGLECYLDNSSDSEKKRATFLDYPVQHGMCIPAKRETLPTYPGYSDEWSDREIWPQHLMELSAIMGMHSVSVIQRTLHHIKIVYHPNKPLEAKAYLAVFHSWGKPLFEKKA